MRSTGSAWSRLPATSARGSTSSSSELPRNSAGKVLKNELRELPGNVIVERRG